MKGTNPAAANRPAAIPRHSPNFPLGRNKAAAFRHWHLHLIAFLATLTLATFANAAAIVVNGTFESVDLDLDPANAAAWTGENGTTILRVTAGGVSGTAGISLSNTTSTSALGPFTQNTGIAGGDPAEGGVEYTFSFDSQRTFANGGVFQALINARDSTDAFLGTALNITLVNPSAAFENFSQTFTSPASTARFEIQFFAITGAATGSSSSVVIDNVQIIPEPSIGLFLWVALASFGAAHRRRV
jgi:hypothetical protein